MRNGRAPAGFRPNGCPFGLQSRSRLGTFEPAKSMESGEVLALGNPCETAKPHSRVPRLGTFEPAKNLESGEVLALGNPCETAGPLQDSGPMGGRLVCRADLVWAPLNPLKAWRVERSWRWATHAQQDSGPMGGRLVCRADLVWAPLNPLKTWRVERYWRWATHAKRQSPCRIQAQWVAVWSAEPISFGHL